MRGINLIQWSKPESGSLTRYYLYNAHGDVTQLTGSTGTVTKNYKYDAFGVEADLDESDQNPFRYCGEYFDSETGTYYLRARYYNPRTGRFTQEDSIHAGLNWYTYCSNNSLAFIDPWGLVQVAIRDFTESRFGTVGWNEKTSTATFSLYGKTLTTLASGQNNHGLTITNVNGRMMADDADLIKYFGVVSYNRNDTAQYAVDNYDKRNPDYYDYSTDCANFVSQSLYTGGISMNDDWYSYKGDFNWNKFLWNPVAFTRGLFNDQYWYNWDVGEPWRLAKSQYEYFSNPQNGYINGSIIALTKSDDIATAVSMYHIQAGDLMYFAGAGGINAHHATIISNIDSNGMIQFAAHTRSQQYQPLSASIGNETVFIIRIRN